MESLYAQRLNRLDFISAKDRFHPFDNAVVAVRPKKISEFRNFFTELSLKTVKDAEWYWSKWSQVNSRYDCRICRMKNIDSISA